MHGLFARMVGMLLPAICWACVVRDPTPYDPATNSMARPPIPTPMAVEAALGLWNSTFGAVKIELADDAVSTPGVAPSNGSNQRLQGVWVYQRDGVEVIGYFSGPIAGNVLRFAWNEPGRNGPLTGSGYVQFGPQGQSFTGVWQTDDSTRRGTWSGWRTTSEQPSSDAGRPPPPTTPPPVSPGQPSAPAPSPVAPSAPTETPAPIEQPPPPPPPPGYGTDN